MIKAIVFDFDGLIVDTENAWFEAFRDVFSEQFGMNVTLEEFAMCIGTENSVLFDALERKVGRPLDRNGIERLTLQKYEEKMTAISLRPGVLEYLKEAKKLGLRIGLASSSSRKWVEHYLTETGIIDYFEVLKTKDDVEQVKPHPELYLQAISSLGVGSAEALAFEDSANGCNAAVAAGLRCVIVPNLLTRTLQFEKYDWRLESMEDCSLSQLVTYLTQS
ncbi:HAD family hydrolase [Brevibacillus sp. SYSU BS000544]|uniref:HAD family hydrolase n=1 Tax=Brevibacillus sp. SYSU BS000544 TaxID=3416443 RepID=UPI003CE52415